MAMGRDPVVIVGGGQSGMAAARAVGNAGLRAVVLEAGKRAAGSWPDYYDSLTLFSPARYSAMPGAGFGGDPDRYPGRDEVVAYLERYAAGLDADVRTGAQVTSVHAGIGRGFVVRTANGEEIPASGVIAASGSFGNPYLPVLPGQDGFTGELLHVAEYRDPKRYAGRRVVVVGSGNSAVQVGYELAEVAQVTLATRHPVRFLPQRIGGRDLHHWLTSSGFDDLPPAWLAQIVSETLVLDTGGYRAALEHSVLDQRQMFTGYDGGRVVWADGAREQVDVVLFATGYRPNLVYLRSLGALDAAGAPLHTGGLSATHPGLGYVGLEFQRSFASNTLRGVSRDAEHVTEALAAWAGGAPAVFGL